MMEELKVSAIQMVSSDQLKDNLKTANGLINQAVSNGAQLVVLPENFALMPKHAGQLFSISEALGEGEIQSFLSEVANENDCWIVAGSMPIKSTRDDKVYATCLVYNSVGEQVAHYHKIHLFDADISDDKGRYRESDTCPFRIRYFFIIKSRGIFAFYCHFNGFFCLNIPGVI